MREVSPYKFSPITAILNSMMLRVRVPVLSVNMYSTCPNYSFREALNTLQPLFLSLLNISTSFWINMAWTDLTISRDTIKEIGIMVLNSTR